jgi:type IV secretory pathway VirB10-like protein
MTNRKHVNTHRKSREKLWIGASILGLGVIVTSCSGNSQDSAPPASSSVSTGAATSSPAPATSAPLVTPTAQPAAPAPIAPAPVAPAPAPTQTVSQTNAVESAQGYLDYSAFSRTGLIKQLQYEKFSTADATYAVDHVTVDWTEQADKSAKSYLDYSAFSRAGLIHQLQYEGFTPAQAKHGATSVGL